MRHRVAGKKLGRKTAHRMMMFRNLVTSFLDKERIRKMVDFNIGIDHLEGWVEQQLNGCTVGIRAYGSRQLHIVAGNAPMISALTIVRNAVSRSDTIIKSPSNDPFTALAIVPGVMAMSVIFSRRIRPIYRSLRKDVEAIDGRENKGEKRLRPSRT